MSYFPLYFLMAFVYANTVYSIGVLLLTGRDIITLECDITIGGFFSQLNMRGYI